ncbi:MAG TPA: hypothetical protein VGO43_03595 [Pyrinomonadaceae bacterium]|nr:hypothetical protein [Pyrinomonadaceae bacterium]
MNDETTFGEFVKIFEAFENLLLSVPAETRGFVALSAKPGEIVERYKFIRKRMRSSPNLKRRLEVTQPGVHYRGGSWQQTEFWLLQKAARSPYIAETADFGCNVLEVTGPVSIDPKRTTLIFSTNHLVATWLDNPYSFRWTVIGGKINKGRGTRQIVVKRFAGMERVEVSLTVVGGEDEEELCQKTTSITTLVRKVVDN